MTQPPATLAQTIILFALSCGEQPPQWSPNARRSLLRFRWIAPPRPLTITDAGRVALAGSPFLARAQRVLDTPPIEPLRRVRLKP